MFYLILFALHFTLFTFLYFFLLYCLLYWRHITTSNHITSLHQSFRASAGRTVTYTPYVHSFGIWSNTHNQENDCHIFSGSGALIPSNHQVHSLSLTNHILRTLRCMIYSMTRLASFCFLFRNEMEKWWKLAFYTNMGSRSSKICWN